MKRAGLAAPGGMAAILGVDIPTLDKVCAEASTPDEIVQVANDNCPGQVVISGAKAAVERAMAGAKSAGAKRALPLAVSIAAHSPLMASIQEEWNNAVQSATFTDFKTSRDWKCPCHAFHRRGICRVPISWLKCNHACAGQTRSSSWRDRESQPLLKLALARCLVVWSNALRMERLSLPLGNPQDFAGLE